MFPLCGGFSFFAFARFGFVLAFGFGTQDTSVSESFELGGAVVPDDVNDAGRRGSPAHRRFNFDLIGTDVEMKPVVPVAGVDCCFGAVDGD
jgi:hypothetical protein